MSVKEEIFEKVIILKESEVQNIENDVDNEKKKILGKLKREYRLMIIFVFFLSLIIIFMVFPMVIAVLLQNL